MNRANFDVLEWIARFITCSNNAGRYVDEIGRSLAVTRPDRNQAEGAQSANDLGGSSEELLPVWRIFPAPASELDVVFCFLPGAMQLRCDVAVLRYHDNRIGRKQRDDRHSFTFLGRTRQLSVNRKNQRQVRVSGRPLAHQIEVAELDNFVAPELEAHRLRHAEAVNVEDPSTNTELRDIVHHRRPLEADRVEMGCEIFRTPGVALSQLEPRVRKRAGQLRSLEQSAGGGEQNSYVTAAETFECLHPLASYFGVRLSFSESFARGIKRDGKLGIHRLEIGEPPLGGSHTFGNNDKKPPRALSAQSGDNNAVAGTFES